MNGDPVRLEVFRNLLHAIAEEMGVTLCRTAFSPNIKERRDYSCALFDGRGRMVAQGDHMPVHLGSMPLSVAAAVRAHTLAPGDVVVLNDPFCGGTHLPDVTLVQGVFLPDRPDPVFYVANRAHHADIGGMTPGSMPLSREIFQEGLRIPPVHLVRRGRMVPETLQLLLANVRTPAEREGDVTAQIAANRTGERRLLELVAKYGVQTVREVMEELLDYAERMTRRAIADMPDGEYRFADAMDDDGQGNGPLELRVRVRIDGDEALVDFAGTAPQTTGCVNAVRAITISAVFYCFRIIVPFPIPSNHGTLRPLTILVPEGSLLDARPPAAVAGGNVETSQRIVDVVLGALAQALPERIPAASSGTMNNLTVGGIDPRTGEPFAYYETVAGGMGARPFADGLDATHTHMTNSLNTPIEALEHAYPFRVTRYEIRRGSGGAGRYRGGDGIRRHLQLLTDARVTVLADRRITRPYGLAGGRPGKPGRTLHIGADGERELPGKCSLEVRAGEVIAVHTPGGGGHGDPAGRSPEAPAGDEDAPPPPAQGSSAA